MVANCMAWSLKITDKLVDAYIHLALNQSACQGCSISIELHKKFGWFIFSTASVNWLDESSGQVAQTSLGMRPLFEDKPTSKVQIVSAASYVLESFAHTRTNFSKKYLQLNTIYQSVP